MIAGLHRELPRPDPARALLRARFVRPTTNSGRGRACRISFSLHLSLCPLPELSESSLTESAAGRNLDVSSRDDDHRGALGAVSVSRRKCRDTIEFTRSGCDFAPAFVKIDCSRRLALSGVERRSKRCAWSATTRYRLVTSRTWRKDDSTFRRSRERRSRERMRNRERRYYKK